MCIPLCALQAAHQPALGASNPAPLGLAPEQLQKGSVESADCLCHLRILYVPPRGASAPRSSEAVLANGARVLLLLQKLRYGPGLALFLFLQKTNKQTTFSMI